MLVAGPPDDYMVQKVDSQKICCTRHPLCHLPVRSARGRVSRGMIMNEDKSISLVENYRMEDISWVRNRFIQASFGENQ